jgi:hypothetical protein
MRRLWITKPVIPMVGSARFGKTQRLPRLGRIRSNVQKEFRVLRRDQVDRHRRIRVLSKTLDAGNRSGALALDSTAGPTGR